MLKFNRDFSNWVAHREDLAICSCFCVRNAQTSSVILQDTRWKDREDIKRARQEEVRVGT